MSPWWERHPRAAPYLRSTARQDGVYNSLASLLVAGHRASCIRTLKHQFRDGDMRTASSRQGPGAPIPATPTSQASCPLAGGSPTSSALLSWGPAFPLARSGAVGGGKEWKGFTVPCKAPAPPWPTSATTPQLSPRTGQLKPPQISARHTGFLHRQLRTRRLVRETSPPAPLSPGDPSAPAAPHGHTPMPTQPRAVPSMPPHWGLAGPAGMRSQGAAAAEITAKSGAKSLGKRAKAPALWPGPIRAELGIREASVPPWCLCAANPQGAGAPSSPFIKVCLSWFFTQKNVKMGKRVPMAHSALSMHSSSGCFAGETMAWRGPATSCGWPQSSPHLRHVLGNQDGWFESS